MLMSHKLEEGCQRGSQLMVNNKFNVQSVIYQTFFQRIIEFSLQMRSMKVKELNCNITLYKHISYAWVSFVLLAALVSLKNSFLSFFDLDLSSLISLVLFSNYFVLTQDQSLYLIL